MSKPRQEHHLPSSNPSLWKRFALIAALAAAGAGAAVLSGPGVLASDDAARPRPAACSGVGHVWWSELITPDPTKVGDFYAKVIGWKLTSVDAQGEPVTLGAAGTEYTTFLVNGDETAGMVRSDNPNAIQAASGWLTYVQVADVDASATAARAAGGSVVREPFVNSEGTRLALVRDPAGNLLGLVTPGRNDPC